MPPRPGRPIVYVAGVPSYEDVAVHDALGRAFSRVSGRLQGNVFAAADLSAGNSPRTPAACTRPELVHGAMDLLLERDPALYIALGGFSASRSPMRRVAHAARGADRLHRRSGLWALPRLHRGRVSLWPSDETRLHRYQLSVGRMITSDELAEGREVGAVDARARQRILTAWELYYSDSVMLLPKLRHDLAGGGFRGAVRLAGEALVPWSDRPVGARGLDAHRLVDLLEIADPELVVTDAIDIGFGGGARTQSAHRLGAILVADNAVAHDVVCARILGQEPSEIPHLLLAAGRGYGPLSMDDIDVVWEVDLETLQTRVEGFGTLPSPVATRFPQWFEESTGCSFPLDLVGGDSQSPEVEALVQDHLLSCFDLPAVREAMKRWPSLSLLLGGPDRAPRHTPVILVGDLATRSFRTQVFSWKTWVRLEHRWACWLGLPAALHRYRLQDGRTGWAFELRGDRPTPGELSNALFYASLGRIRAPVDGWFSRCVDAWWAWQSSLRRSIRNRAGIAVVHARKIPRVHGRSWRQRWLRPAALKLRPPVPPLPSVRSEGPVARKEQVGD